MSSSTAGPRIMVVGSGTRFLSGISVYTLRLANSLAAAGARVSLMTMRQLLPTRLYPGRDRVGSDLTDLRRDDRVHVFDGVDWFWIPSLFRGLLFLGRQRPDALILEWWSGTVLHTYLVLSLFARLLGSRVVIEFHEVLDTGEIRLPLVKPYAAFVGSLVVRLASAFVVHSAFDRQLLAEHYPLGSRSVTVIRHGPYDHYSGPAEGTTRPAIREAPDGVTNILFFGVIRPYKGLEDLVDAFDLLAPNEVERYWLTVVGETWEGWTLPAQKIAQSRYRDRITFVNRYVHDQELDGYLGGADVVALPYIRSSISGPLHVAMTYGLPIVMTDVGGNAEAAGGYEGLRLVPAANPAALIAAVQHFSGRRGARFDSPGSWSDTARSYLSIVQTLLDPGTPTTPPAAEPDGTG